MKHPLEQLEEFKNGDADESSGEFLNELGQKAGD
jgi:hypothetical protein